MTHSDLPSLRITFDVTRTRAVLRARQGLEGEFGMLATRVTPGGQRGPLTSDADLDSFLSSLSELADWPHADVAWEPELASLVTGVLDDSETVQARLGSPPAGTRQATPAPEDVHALLGTEWQADLTSFQLRDIGELLSLGHGANFSVPGAGKTRTALAVFSALRERGEVRRLLVVCPKSAYEAWQFEGDACHKDPLLTSVMDNGALAPEADVVLVNYERLSGSVSRLAEWLRTAPAMFVLDEAHRMKLGARGAYGSACLSLGPLARRRLILTGTPAPNGARDLESLLSFVWPGRGKQLVVEAVSGGDLAYASQALRPLFTRTTKKELGLPPFEPLVRYVELPPLHRELYNALRGNPSARRGDLASLGKAAMRMLMAAISPALLAPSDAPYDPLAFQLPTLDVSDGDSLHTLLQRLPQHELSPKYAETVRIIARNVQAGRKTLVWTGFIRSQKTLEELLAPQAPASVYGATPTQDREAELSRFREDPTCMVLISNPATLGEGISLHQVCHDAVYVDRDFMAGRFLQSLDRIHRLGLPPDTETRVTVLAARGTIDEIVAMRLEKKLHFLGSVLDDPAVRQLGDLQEEETTGLGMDADDIHALLAHLDSRPL
ncbi:DEAD/DEAH box helicase [Streptomyces sp. AMCC400023]|uniref:DEAD/DEAH box helicase n=1 Tax=Streptomyces sp. AMCC400023 TaxID=2056258 RepID=UPI001F34C24A|nr:DEAD/DEAH box helicase [Streptomyces sp. AMCC400023]UJV43212.1 DNA helicase [Streptomyces sp. AMCC400023]